MLTRRDFFRMSGMGMVVAGLVAGENLPQSQTIIKPPKLMKGDRIALVSPAFAAFNEMSVQIKVESLESMGLEVVKGKNFFNRYGYLAGTDEERAADINAAFADPKIKAVIAHSGGWGCARILPHLDYDLIRKNPKVVLGFSDITALLNGIHSQTGLVTFHGPCPRNKTSAEFTEQLIMEGTTPLLVNKPEPGENLAPTSHRIRTITPGKARGRLVGGNLTVLSAIMGSPYVPSFEDKILFIEDVEEQIYRIDRMLTQLKLAGVFNSVKGVIFGTCSKCGPGERYGSLTLREVLDDHIQAAGIPAFEGFMIGHIKEQFTLPIGVSAEMDAVKGSIQLLEPAVV